MPVSRWCEEKEALPVTVYECGVNGAPGREYDTAVSGHNWCRGERWHDEYHGKDPGCCASPEEAESWACTCSCHTEVKP